MIKFRVFFFLLGVLAIYIGLDIYSSGIGEEFTGIFIVVFMFVGGFFSAFMAISPKFFVEYIDGII